MLKNSHEDLIFAFIAVMDMDRPNYLCNWYCNTKAASTVPAVTDSGRAKTSIFHWQHGGKTTRCHWPHEVKSLSAVINRRKPKQSVSLTGEKKNYWQQLLAKRQNYLLSLTEERLNHLLSLSAWSKTTCNCCLCQKGSNYLLPLTTLI
jgi:hypothetical protein